MSTVSEEQLRRLRGASSAFVYPAVFAMFTSLSAERCDELIESKFQGTGIPGAQFVALARDGTTLYSKTIGTRTLDGIQAMTDDTVSNLVYSDVSILTWAGYNRYSGWHPARKS